MNEAEIRAYLQRLRDDFCYFYTELCRFVGLRPPCRMRLDIAHWHQYGPPRRGILAKRKIGKSNISCAYDCWRWFRNPNEQIFCVSSDESLASNILALDRKWLSVVPFLRHLLPNKPSPQDKVRDNRTEFDIGCANRALLLSPSMSAKSIGGKLAGPGATLVRPDDIEQDNNTITQAARARLYSLWDEFENIAKRFEGESDGESGDVLVNGTPHHEESLYRKLADERGYVFRAWPGVYPHLDETVPGLSPLILDDLRTGRAKPGDPVFPDVFSAEDVALLRLRMSKSAFAMQVMLRTDLLETEVRPLRLDDLIVMDIHRDIAPEMLVWGHKTQNQSTRLDIPSVGFGTDAYYAPVLIGDKWLPYRGTIAALDPAGRGKDEMAWAVVSQLHGNLFLKHVGGVYGGATPENLDVIVNSLREHGARELIIETNFGGDYLIPLIEPVIRKFSLREGQNDMFPSGWGCAIIPAHSTGQKEKRIIDSLAPVTQQHRLIVDKKVARDTKWAQQYARITLERGCLDHDDRIEATAMAVSAFKNVLHQDDSAIINRKRKDEQISKLRKIANKFAPPKTPNWINY